MKFIIAICPMMVFAESPSDLDLNGHLNLDVPQSAGFAMLGVTPDKVIEPLSGRELGLSILQGLDGHGNFQSGFALETRPYFWNEGQYVRKTTTLDRFLSGFKFSFATASGLQNSDKANRYGAGVNWSYQFNDPLFNDRYLACITEENDKIVLPIPDPNANKTDLQAKLTAAHKECMSKYISWTTTALAAGFAGQKGKDSDTDLEKSGYGAWLTGSYAFNKKAELTTHYRYVKNQLAVIDDQMSNVDASIAAARFRYGNDSLKGIVESSWNKEKSVTKNDEYTLLSTGLEFKVAKSAWFRVAYGKSFGSSSTTDDIFSGQLRFGLGESPLSKY
ncbi:hypothetical protein [Acinetobacter proteolyticus]|uniref:hypothetical protein n=1 Tax=Acinetobacter proteolyticus TaxID=1776741 RepID=UPI00135B8917|nr:hypothetical protein [Acinetobacter proteolyticus]